MPSHPPTVEEYIETNKQVSPVLSADAMAIVLALRKYLGGIDGGGEGGDGVPAVPVNSVAVRTPHWHLMGASESFDIPATATSWYAVLQTGTGTIGGVALVVGATESSQNGLNSVLTVTTGTTSSARIGYETAA